MQTVTRTHFTTVKTEGAILPAELLQRIAEGKQDGLSPEDYHLAKNERLNEQINRSWNRLLGVWQAFDAQREKLPTSDRGTTLTRENWLLILFQELGFGRLSFLRSITVDEQTRYRISHQWQHVPIHLITFRQDLDRRDDTVRRSPHSLMQEFLNRSPEHLWGMLSNGTTLRILRDNASLTRAAYLEFDLEAMMEGEVYADFSLLWLICHQSRFELGRDADAPDTPANCWLEYWSQQAIEDGTRALDSLRDGVQEAIEALGRGFLAHRANSALKQSLREGLLSTQDYYRELLRMVYRLIFLFVAEDRDLLFVPGTEDAIQKRYQNYYSLNHLRDLAERNRGGPHPDLYRSLRLVFNMLREGYADLGLPGLNSFLFSGRSTPSLDGADIANSDLLDAIRALAFTIEGRVRRPVDYRNLGAEELGSVYESLLEYHPQLNIDAATFELETAAGSERKTTGSYYTPTSLITSLLDSALEPVVKDRLTGKTTQEEREQAILDIKVVDPACGSGHFLIAAANRLAAHLASVRTGDDEPSPAARRDALREVVRHCIHGVDINEMAVELCKVGLWMEALDPGKPLTFLEHNIQCGNSLVGVGPGMELDEIPDDAFRPVTGDDKKTATALRKRNKRERTGQRDFFRVTEFSTVADWNSWLASQVQQLEDMPEDDVAAVYVKEQKWRQYRSSERYQYGKRLSDLWTAAFFWPIPKGNADSMLAPSHQALRTLKGNQSLAPDLQRRVNELAVEQQFFHWEMAYPEVFDHERKGFDVILGNPPWERIKLQEKEFFAQYSDEVTQARTAAIRRKMIKALVNTDPFLYHRYQQALQGSENTSNFLRRSGHYPLSAVGDINTYQVFGGLAHQLVNPAGRVGIILPTGIATDYSNREFFSTLVEQRELASLYDFENRMALFPGVHRSYKFCLLTMSGTGKPVLSAEFAFFLHDPAQLRDKERVFTLSREDFQRINPNTRTCPVFRTRRDAEITRDIYSRIPVLVNEETGENPWGIKFSTMFHMANNSNLFHMRDDLESRGFTLDGNRFVKGAEQYLPLYEPKMIHQWDHRFATYHTTDQIDNTTDDNYHNPHYSTMPRYWIKDLDIPSYSSLKVTMLFAFRDIARATDERTGIFAFLPFGGGGNVMGVNANPSLVTCLIANLCSYALDFIIRQKIGGTHLNFFYVRQFPVLEPNVFLQSGWQSDTLTQGFPQGARLLDSILPQVLELTYTAWDLEIIANDCGYSGPPFIWDEERRFLIRCELDALYFHLYGIQRDDVNYIMETFPIVKRKDEAAYGEYRTKNTILDIYDAMQQAMDSGQPYPTRLDPPPGDPRVAHPWDESYLGPYRDPSTWWQPVDLPDVQPAKAKPASKPIAQPHKLAPQAKQKPAQKPVPPPKRSAKRKAPVAQPTLLEPPDPKAASSREAPPSERRQRVMDLSKQPNAHAVRDLVSYLADEDTSVRFMARSALMQCPGVAVINALMAFLPTLDDAALHRALPEAVHTLATITKTAEDEDVRETAGLLHAQLGGKG